MYRELFTNYCLQSGHPDTSPWSNPTSTGLTPSVYTSSLPTGVDAMVTFTDLGAAAHFVNTSPAIPLYTDAIISGYVRKMAGTGWMAASIDGGASVAYFDINTLTTGLVSAGLTQAQIVETDVANIYRWSFKQRTTNDIRLRTYIANANATASYSANGNSLAFGGFQVEVAAPGQLTPSPPVASGATVGLGQRDYRQNVLRQSERVDLSPWSNARVTFAAGTDGGIDITDSAVVGSHFVSQTFTSLAIGTPNCVFIADVKPISGAATWFVMSTDAAATNVAYFNLTGAGALGTVVGCTAEIVKLTSDAYRCIIRGVVPNSRAATLWMSQANGIVSYGNGGAPSVIRVYRTQLAQTNYILNYVKTTSGIWCPSGAPRLLIT